MYPLEEHCFQSFLQYQHLSPRKNTEKLILIIFYKNNRKLILFVLKKTFINVIFAITIAYALRE